MKGKQLALVLLLLVAVGGVALYLNSQSTAVWKETATTATGKVLDFPLNDVSQVTIKEGAAELNLIKKDDVWTVKERADFPADFQKTGALIRKLWELKPVQDIKVGPSQLARLQLTEPAAGSNNGTLIDLKGAGDKRIIALLLGKKHLRNQDESAAEGGSFPVGRYVMTQDNAHHVYLVSDTFDEVQLKPEQWLTKDFFKAENLKSISVTGTTPAVNWKIVRDNATSPWKFADPKPGEEIDTSKSNGVSSIFTYLSFADVMPADAPVAETGLDKPSTVHLETFDNISYDLKIGKLNGENYPVLVSIKGDLPKERTPGADEKPEDKTKLDQEFESKQKPLAEKLAKEQKLPARPFLIAKATVEQILKERSALVAEKKSASPTPGGMMSPAVKSIPSLPHPVSTPAKPK
jgi:hypothetical protein